MRPPKTYPLTLSDVDLLAQALAAADDYIPEDSKDKRLIVEAHAVLVRALGMDDYLIYGPQEEEAA